MSGTDHSISKNFEQSIQEQINSGKKNVFQYEGKLYPTIQPYKTHRLKVSPVHDIHVEELGNPQGKPVVVLHGGPGGGCEPFYAQFFDPTFYRIVMFDQRGCGQSLPFACLEDNTTWHLVEDIEKIRVLLGVDQWHIVFGGSWGSTLSLSYAETHPSRVKSLVLRGIFTLRREELVWFYQKGNDMIFPDYFDAYLKPIPENERGDIMSAYHRRLTGTDEKAKIEAALAWTTYEMATSKLIIDKEKVARGEDPQFALAFARIENHFFINGGWFKEGQLINDAHILKNIPTFIAQGRYDVVCPAKSAWDLKKAIGENCELVIVGDSGHSVSEPGITSVLVQACDKFKNL